MDVWYYGVRYARGCEPSDLWKTYFTSSERVAAYRREHGDPDVVEVRKTFMLKSEAQAWEDRVLRRARCVQLKHWLNGSNGGRTFNADNPITRARVAEANRGKKRSAAQCATMSAAAAKRPVQTKETRDKRAASLSGLRRDEKSRALMRGSKSEEARAKMKAAALNMSDEHKLRISMAKQNQSEETRRKIAESIKLVWIARKQSKAINTLSETICLA